MNSLISIGSNYGNILEHINNSKILLQEKSNTIKSSKLMKTSPIGFIKQNDFYNQIILIETKLKPIELLTFLKAIEKKIGRTKRQRWKEREIDLDILTYENIIFNTNDLIIPHKELHNRLFILDACKALLPEYLVPRYDKTFLELYELNFKRLAKQKITYID
jgi:2-amino-4-hydroxy-6-hydroxymethyldihydropteridine diphosphokinase